MPKVLNSSSSSELVTPPPISRFMLGYFLRTSAAKKRSVPSPLPTRCRSSRMVSSHLQECKSARMEIGDMEAQAGHCVKSLPSKKSILKIRWSGSIHAGSVSMMCSSRNVSDPTIILHTPSSSHAWAPSILAVPASRRMSIPSFLASAAIISR